jgi:hypothetical protein
MAEIKREIRTLGQRVSGLTAGNTYTFVLKRPNVRVDVFNALRSVELAEGQLVSLGKLLHDLEGIRGEAELGDGGSARSKFKAIKAMARDCSSQLSDAREFAVRAAEDAKDAHADVKDAYNAAKDGADHATSAGEALMSGLDEVLNAVDASIIEAELGESAAADDTKSSADGN